MLGKLESCFLSLKYLLCQVIDRVHFLPLHCSLISWTSGVGSVWLEITVHDVFSLIYNVTLTVNHLST